jgi:hypothetical protein
MAKLGPETAHIFRITHVSNVPCILDHGLHCKNSPLADPNFVPIGMPDLIQKRTARGFPCGPGGTLGDYFPFYFTPRSVMILNIKTGYNEVVERPDSEIVILVSSLPKLQKIGTRFVFTTGHAYLQESDYFEDLSDLDRIDWDLLRSGDFRRDPEDPGKLSRYQAEALVHRHLPVSGLLGIACYDEAVRE